jgi:hypothetical protein
MTKLVLSKSFTDIISASTTEMDAVKEILLDLTKRSDLNLSVNFIGAGSQNDEVTFVTSSKLKSFLEKGECNWKVRSFLGVCGFKNNKELFNTLGVNHEVLLESPSLSELGRKPLTILSEAPKADKIYCLVGVRDKSVVRQFVINKACLTNVTIGEYVSTLTPSVGKVGRVVKNILNDTKSTATDYDVEKFVNVYKSASEMVKNRFKNFRIVSGDDIHKFYRYETYATRNGSLGKSCMREASPERTSLYTTNPDKCSLVILVDKFENGKPTSIKGRALLWTGDDGEKLMDRIYTNKDSDVLFFKQFAQENGFWSKSTQAAHEKYLDLNGVKKSNSFRITMDLTKVPNNGGQLDLPYVDSFNMFRDSCKFDEDGNFVNVVITGKY